ncbi:hypothetical protein ACFSUS_10695 [Spirosoma soli]|uniref:HMA domain-containing protein n=1 Tax=Spirosoma soli TaxID=1770529 RepID=A0ABW5M365_9BACT
MTNVLVFRTNINSDKRIHQAACRLCKLRGICRWSIDLEDSDCVLRVETDQLTEADIIRLLTRAGFQCDSLN